MKITRWSDYRVNGICHHGHPSPARASRKLADKYGSPTGLALRAKTYLDYQTGDLVRAEIPKGKYAVRHVGRLVTRFRPSFRLSPACPAWYTLSGKVTDSCKIFAGLPGPRCKEDA